MSGMQFSSNVITVVAWPLVALLLLVVYRNWIVAGISTAIGSRQIKKFKVGPVEFEWFSEISSAGQDVGTALTAMPVDEQAVPTSLVDLIPDVNKNPRGGIRRAFRLVRRALDESYPGLATVPQGDLANVLDNLARRGVLHADVRDAIGQLQNLLDMSNSDVKMVDPARGYLFLLLAEGAIHGILRSAEIHASEIHGTSPAVRPLPAGSSWQGWYNRDFVIELRLDRWIGSTTFEGQMLYPGSETVTGVTGQVITTESVAGLTAIAWKEDGYITKGSRAVDLGGEYKATVSGNVVSGNWFKGEQRLGEFQLLSR
jgi:hypothetical protein